jgi:site-specific recombinase XerD
MASTPHPDFALLGNSWDLSLRADGYAANTITSYRRALRMFADWLAGQSGNLGPGDVTRDHIRGWVVHVRDTTSSGTARSWFAGVRHFFRWLVEEGEIGRDPTASVKTPKPNDPSTPVLSLADLRALLKTCNGKMFPDRRDTAIIMLFADGGLRLAELAALNIDAVDIAGRIVLVEGKGSMRSGPRKRAAPIGVKAAKALDGYLRIRRRHPYADSAQLWLGDRNRPNLSRDGVKAVMVRRGKQAGVVIHPHMLRHTWAHEFRSSGGGEGDLMVLGGWRSRLMLDRYGSVMAGERARDAYRLKSLGDRL